MTDFDPDAKAPPLRSSLDQMPSIIPPKKKPEAEGVTNELAGGSAFFPGYRKDQRVPSPSIGRPVGRPTDEAAKRRPDRPAGKRLIVRRGFDWYEDQLAALKKLSLTEQLEGKPGSMSQMVREALDAYLSKRASDR